MLNFKKYEHNNQYIAKGAGFVFFKSYDSLIAYVNTSTKEVVLGDDWNYSNTTLRHLNDFLNDFYGVGCYFTKEVEKLIKAGVFVQDQTLIESLLNVGNAIK